MIHSLRNQPTFLDSTTATTAFPAQNDVCEMSAENLPHSVTNQKHYSDLRGDASSVWNFWACLSDVVLWEKQWRCHEMSGVFSG